MRLKILQLPANSSVCLLGNHFPLHREVLEQQQAIDNANNPKQRKPKQFRRLVLDGNVSADLLKKRFGISDDDFEQFLNEVREAPPKK